MLENWKNFVVDAPVERISKLNEMFLAGDFATK